MTTFTSQANMKWTLNYNEWQRPSPMGNKKNIKSSYNCTSMFRGNNTWTLLHPKVEDEILECCGLYEVTNMYQLYEFNFQTIL
jgi:hypothetical protein